MEKSREALFEGGRGLRREGGAGILAGMLLEILDGGDAVVDSIRTPAEVEALRSRGDFVLIEVRADEESRWQRMTSRGRTGDPTETETLLSQEAAEAKSEDEAGQALDATAALADITILNDGSIEDLEEKLEGIWSGLRGP